MKELSKNAFKRILAYDFRVFCRQYDRNRTRFYKFLVCRRRDVEIHAVAVKTRKDGTRAIKEVVRSSVEDPCLWLKDIMLVPMAGYVVDWSRENAGRKLEWDYYGKWELIPYTRKSHAFKLYAPVVNPEALRGLKRFRWCAWTEECGNILDYLKLYTEHPRIEMLSKAGVGGFARLPKFVAKLEKDKAFCSFFSKHLEAIKALGCFNVRTDVVYRAYRLGISIEEAREQIETLRKFRGYAIPPSIDLFKAATYLKSKKVEHCAYASYLSNCSRLGFDLGDTKNAFPRYLKARMIAVKEQVAVLDRQAKASEAKKLSDDLSWVATKVADLEKLRGPFRVILPRKEREFISEGKKLDHCVGNGEYVERMAKGEAVIAFIRKAESPQKPFVTVEYVPGELRIKQCYGRSGSRPEAKVLKFVNGLFLNKAIALSRRVQLKQERVGA